jgi:RiboL-PSP-HEPN
MRNRRISQNKDRLDNLFEQAKQIKDVEMLGHWSRYLCVLVSGFIETSIQAILLDYADKKSAPEISHFVSQQVRDFQNAKMSKILALLGDFSPTISASIEAATDGELKESVDSIVQNRHQIAHGQTTGISLVTVKKYYENVVKVLEIVEANFGT